MNTFLIEEADRLFKMDKKRNGNYNLRCPLCGDSETRLNLKRGWLLKPATAGGLSTYFCHNCGQSMSIYQFIKMFEPDLDVSSYKLQRTVDKIKSFNTASELAEQFETNAVVANKNRHFIDVIALGYEPISDLEESHYARQYLDTRQVLKSKYGQIYFVEDFKTIVYDLAKVYPKMEMYIESLDRMGSDSALVFPFYLDDGSYKAIQFRFFNKPDFRYMILDIEDHDDTNILGIADLNPSSPIYIAEGTVDAMMFPNCLSSLSHASMISSAEHIIKTYNIDKSQIRLIFDRDYVTNKDVRKQFDKAIELGYYVYPYEELRIVSMDKCKDLNDIIVKGYMSAQELVASIYTKSLKGLKARLYVGRLKPLYKP